MGSYHPFQSVLTNLALCQGSHPVGSPQIILDVIELCQFFSIFVFIASLLDYCHPHLTQSICRSKIHFNQRLG